MKNQELKNTLLPRVKEIGVSEQTLAKEISFALQHVNKNQQLKKADGTSVMQSIMNVCQVGLSLNPVQKLGYLVPRWDSLKKINTVAFEPSYQGLVKLLTDSGSVSMIYSHLVYEGDIFEVSFGTSTELVHKPKFASKKITHVYAVAILPNGLKVPEVMTMEEIEAIRERSDSYKAFKAGKIKSCVWSTDEGEMARKTVIRRIFKYLPKSESFEKLAKAISYDEQDYTASPEQLDYIDQLLEQTSISLEKQEQITLEMNSYSQEQAANCINYLKNNQIDPIDSGSNYGQKEIHAKLDKMGL